MIYSQTYIKLYPLSQEQLASGRTASAGACIQKEQAFHRINPVLAAFVFIYKINQIYSNNTNLFQKNELFR